MNPIIVPAPTQNQPNPPSVGPATTTPTVVNPITPAGTHPTTPAGTAPASPAGTNPTTPAGTNPTTPAVTAPASPAGTSPTTPAGTGAGSPAATNPSPTIPPGSTPAPSTSTTSIHPTGLDQAQSAKWFADNFHKDFAPSPIGPMQELKVVSWMQVPHILQQLQNPGTQVRLTFPQPTPADAAVVSEQAAIKKFLVDCAGREMKEIAAEVVKKIDTCDILAKKLVAFDATQYVAQFKLNANNTDQLTVAEVIRTNEHFAPAPTGGVNTQPAAKNGRDVILGAVQQGVQATNAFRSYVIEVVSAHQDVAQQTLKERYDSWNPKPDVQYAKVWVAPDFTSAPNASAQTVKVDEYDLLTFIGLGGRTTPVVLGARKQRRAP